MGVNKFTIEEPPFEGVFKISDEIRIQQTQKLQALKNQRDNTLVQQHLANIKQCATDNINLMPAVIEAVDNYATLGEIADTLRNVFGEF